MPTSIFPLTENDIPTANDYIRWSKLSLTINRILWHDWPNLEAQIASGEKAIRDSFEDPATEHLKAVDDESGELIGYLVLTRRKPAPTAETKHQVTSDPEKPAVSSALNVDVLAMVTRTIEEIAAEIEGLDHLEITFIVVKQGRRMQGVGRRLLEVAFERSNKENLPLVVCSEPAARAFFERIGFEETKHSDMDLSVHASPMTGFGLFRLTGMIRRPEVTGSVSGELPGR